MIFLYQLAQAWTSLWITYALYPADKPPTRLFCSYFYSRFHPHASYSLTGCAIYSTHERFCFHHSQNRKLHALRLPSAVKMKSSCTLESMREVTLNHVMLICSLPGFFKLWWRLSLLCNCYTPCLHSGRSGFGHRMATSDHLTNTV